MAAMATVTSPTLTYLIHHLLRQTKLASPVCLFLRPFSVSVSTRKSNHHDERRFPSFFPSTSSSLPLPRPFISLSSLLVSKSFSSAGESEQDQDNNVSLASRGENNDEEEEEERSQEMMIESSALKLSVKEKKKLASYAHSLDDKLKCQLVGKSGVTDSVVFSFLETLKKNELLKVKIHKTCPGELEDVILHLEKATGSVVAGKIARTVILYRPSPTKLKAEEKNKGNTDDVGELQ